MPQPLILVAEDDNFVALLIRQALEDCGMRVIVANDGREALAALWLHLPDVIVLDAVMPRMDGFQVLRRLKADRKYKDIPVLMLTALRQQKSVARATAEGAAGYLLKPFRPDHLVERVRHFVDLRRQPSPAPLVVYV